MKKITSQQKRGNYSGSTISTLLHDRINPKDCQVLFLGDTGFLQFFRVVSRDYGKPRCCKRVLIRPKNMGGLQDLVDALFFSWEGRPLSLAKYTYIYIYIYIYTFALSFDVTFPGFGWVGFNLVPPPVFHLFTVYRFTVSYPLD